MLLRNNTDKSVSKRLPDREWITLKPGEEYDFPDVVGYTEDPRLTKVEEVKSDSVLGKKAAAKLAEIKADLLDDGKLNYSNNPNKKSPGRKKKK